MDKHGILVNIGINNVNKGWTEKKVRKKKCQAPSKNWKSPDIFVQKMIVFPFSSGNWCSIFTTGHPTT